MFSCAARADVSFVKEVAPILLKRCTGCHGERTNLGGYRTGIAEKQLRSAPKYRSDNDWNWEDRTRTLYELGPSGLLVVQRECVGVTAACSLLRMDVFEQVGGLTPLLHSNFNDVDFSLKIRSFGHRIVWTPYVEMYHFESQTREPTPTEYEHLIIRNRWHEQLLSDPYYNHNLAPRRDDWVEKAMR